MGNQEITQAITEIKESVQLSKWQSEIEERQAGGLSVDAWCSRQGISKNTYYYRLQAVWDKSASIAKQSAVGISPLSTVVLATSPKN